MQNEKPNLFSRQVTDVYITKGKARATIRADSIKGHDWLNTNMSGVREGVILVDNDSVDEIEALMFQSGLCVSRKDR